MGRVSVLTEPSEPAERHAAKPDIEAPVLDVVVPVHNEERDLESCVRRLHDHLTEQLPYPFRITIADNASTDTTPHIAARLTAELPDVTVVHLAQKGRGRALRAAWSASNAKVLAYCDVDLSTDLSALLPLVAPLISGHSDVAIGTRLSRGSRVVRGLRRELISRGYNVILHGTLATGFSDAQCGFKAIRADVAEHLLPLVQDNEWFFDTELLVLAERARLRIHEVPVDWVDDPDSRVDILATAIADLKGIARLARDLAVGRVPISDLHDRFGRGALSASSALPGQLVRFAVIGALSTLAHLAGYALLRMVMNPLPANMLALLGTALANTAANRRFTFGVRVSTGRIVHQLRGLVVFVVGLAVTSGALSALGMVAPHASRMVELLVLFSANALATIVRFIAFRSWVFRGAA